MHETAHEHRAAGTGIEMTRDEAFQHLNTVREQYTGTPGSIPLEEYSQYLEAAEAYVQHTEQQQGYPHNLTKEQERLLTLSQAIINENPEQQKAA